MKLATRIAALIAFLIAPTMAIAAEWSEQEYGLYSGDFNGDGRSDLLYVAINPAKSSGIAIAGSSGSPDTAWQTWPSNYLGIPWHSNTYVPLIADFNGDGKSDVLLQRQTPGDHYLLVADMDGRLTGTHQTIANGALGLDWAANQHKVIAGDFSGDGKADLFFQAMSSAGVNAVVYADANGQFTSAPTQLIYDGDLGFKWSTQSAIIHTGQFNGGTGPDRRADLLIQARPSIALIDFDIPIPVPVHAPDMNGMLYSQGGASPFALAGVQRWSRNANGVDWSPLRADIVVGDFDGNGTSDVLLQGKHNGQQSYLLNGMTSGAAFSSATAITSSITLTRDSARLVVGNFDGAGGAGIFVQALTPSGIHYLAQTVGSSITASTHDPAPAMVVPASEVGRTPGSFAVSPSGASNYMIPLWAPPGTGGLTHGLSLSYDSRLGNGVLGTGWFIDGLSTITRCPWTIAQDGQAREVNLTTSDRFCLDGQRLRLVSGTYGVAGSTYATEIDVVARVKAYSSAGNGPGYFVVESKDGLKRTYGGQDDSRIEVVGSSPATPRLWALSRIEDRSGNAVTFKYTEDNTGAYRLDEVAYTVNSVTTSGQYLVKMTYDPRSDVIESYEAGSGYQTGGQIVESKLLGKIEIKHGGSTVRRYVLGYGTGAGGRSRLASVQECATGSGHCLAPTTIHWQNGQAGLNNEVSSAATVGEAPYVMDVNGDGRDDLVWSNGSTWQILFAGSSGGYASSVTDTGITVTNAAKALPIEWNGDGRGDLLVAWSDGAWRVLISNGSSLAGPFSVVASGSLSHTQGWYWVADVNGDGRDDLLRAHNQLQTSNRNGQLYVALKQPDGYFGSMVFTWEDELLRYANNPFGPANQLSSSRERNVDFNGDGREDIALRMCDTPSPTVCPYWEWRSVFGAGAGVAPAFAPTHANFSNVNDTERLWYGKFNADSYTDIAYLTDDDHIYVAYSRGAGAGTLPGISISGYDTTRLVVIDYDGDGYDDLVVPRTDNETWYVARSNGQALLAPVSTGLSSSGATRPVAADINGDGLVDLAYSIAGSNNWRYRLHLGVPADLLQRVVDGYGNSTEFAYLPMTDDSVYTKGGQAIYPARDEESSLPVVRSATITIPGQSAYQVTYSYANARVDQHGRGWLGFGTMVSKDSRTLLSTTETYRQDFPYTGFTTSVVTSRNSQQGVGPPVSATTYSPGLHTFGSGFDQRYLPYVASSTVDEYVVNEAGSFDGTLMRTTQTTNTVDSYGTIYDRLVEIQEKGSSGAYGGKIHTQHTIVVDRVDNETTWCLGRPKRTEETNSNSQNSGDAEITITRRVDHSWDETHCRPTDQIIQPEDALWEVTTHYDYDSFGNIDLVRVTPAANQGQAARETSIEWGTTGQFPMSVTNAESQLTSFQWDFAKAVRTQIEDPNNLTTLFTSDLFGRIQTEVRPDGASTIYTLSSCSAFNSFCGAADIRARIDVTTQKAGTVIRTDSRYLDSMERERSTSQQLLTGAYSTTTTTYDVLGRVASVSTPHTATDPIWYTSFAYDVIGRPKQINRPVSEHDPSTHMTKYEYAGHQTIQTDALNRTTKFTYDARGQVVQVTDAGNNETGYEYSPFGELLKTRDANGTEVVAEYNIRGLKVKLIDPDLGEWNYDYYPLGELKRQISPKASSNPAALAVHFTYDKLSRPRTRSEPEGTTEWIWDTAPGKGIGQLASVAQTTAQPYSETYTYDNVGRLISTALNAGGTVFTVQQSYAATGELETVTYPNSTGAAPLKVKYAYEHGLLSSVRDFTDNVSGTTYWKGNAMDARGQYIDTELAMACERSTRMSG